MAEFVFCTVLMRTNKELWLGKLKVRFHFGEDYIENRIILNSVLVK